MIFLPTGEMGRFSYAITSVVIGVVFFIALIFLPFALPIVALLFGWISICVNSKRLHNIGVSGWWQFIPIVPMIASLYFDMDWIGIVRGVIGIGILLFLLFVEEGSFQ